MVSGEFRVPNYWYIVPFLNIISGDLEKINNNETFLPLIIFLHSRNTITATWILLLILVTLHFLKLYILRKTGTISASVEVNLVLMHIEDFR